MPFPIFRLGDQPEVVRDHTRGDKRTHFGHLADRPVRRTVSLLLYDLMAWASRIRGLWAEGLGSFEIDHQLLPDWLPRRRLRGWTARRPRCRVVFLDRIHVLSPRPPP